MTKTLMFMYMKPYPNKNGTSLQDVIRAIHSK